MNIAELEAQQAALAAQIAAAKQAAKVAGLEQIKTIATEAGISVVDIVAIFPAPAKVQKPAAIAPKYKDAAGNTWSGRGLQPKWLKTAIAGGAKLESFAIATH